jgi:membrane protein DedA with SNARE-associated domain
MSLALHLVGMAAISMAAFLVTTALGFLVTGAQLLLLEYLTGKDEQ